MLQVRQWIVCGKKVRAVYVSGNAHLTPSPLGVNFSDEENAHSLRCFPPETSSFVELGEGNTTLEIKLLHAIPEHETERVHMMMQRPEVLSYLRSMQRGDMIVVRTAKKGDYIGLEIEGCEIMFLGTDKCASGWVQNTGWSDSSEGAWCVHSKMKNVREAEEVGVRFRCGIVIMVKILNFVDLTDPDNMVSTVRTCLCSTQLP
jgi:hypothetical protein